MAEDTPLVSETLQKMRAITTTEDARKFLDGSEGAALMGALQERGVTEDDMLVRLGAARYRRVHLGNVAEPLAIVGAAAATLAVPIAELASNGITSWQSFQKAAPKSAALGLVFGAVSGLALGAFVTRRREKEIQGITEYLDKLGVPSAIRSR